MKYSVAVSTPDTGYFNVLKNSETEWSLDQPIGVTHSEGGGLSVTNGKRTIVDRLNVRGFDLGSVEIYGKDEPAAISNAYSGSMTIGLIFGSPADSPIYFVPAAVTAGVGAVVGTLLLVKKRKRE